MVEEKIAGANKIVFRCGEGGGVESSGSRKQVTGFRVSGVAAREIHFHSHLTCRMKTKMPEIAEGADKPALIMASYY